MKLKNILFDKEATLLRKYTRIAVIEGNFKQTHFYKTGPLSGTTNQPLEAERCLEGCMAQDVAKLVNTTEITQEPAADDELVLITPEMLETYRLNQSSLVNTWYWRSILILVFSY
jgi:hypothetical protein